MPYKSNEWKSQGSKKKKSSDLKTSNLNGLAKDKKVVESSINSNNITKSSAKKGKTGSKQDLSKEKQEISESEQEVPQVKKSKIRRAVTLCRRLLSWTMIIWLGYFAFFVCGKPNGPKNLPLQSDICSAIDTAKLDFLSLFETDFYKTHVDPVVLPIKNKVEELYLHHGMPAQAKISDLYMQHGKYYVDQSKKNSQHVFKYKIKPAAKKLHSNVVNHPVSKQASQKLSDVYNHKHTQFVLQKSNQAYRSDAVQKTITKVKKMTEPEAIKAGWNRCVKQVNYIVQEVDKRLPGPALKLKEHIKGWIHYAENTDMKVFLNHLYWSSVDCYNNKVVPFMKTNPYVRRARVYYKKNIEGFVNYNIKPAMITLNNRWHFDQLYYKLVSYLPTSR